MSSQFLAILLNLGHFHHILLHAQLTLLATSTKSFTSKKTNTDPVTLLPLLTHQLNIRAMILFTFNIFFSWKRALAHRDDKKSGLSLLLRNDSS